MLLQLHRLSERQTLLLSSLSTPSYPKCTPPLRGCICLPVPACLKPPSLLSIPFPSTSDPAHRVPMQPLLRPPPGCLWQRTPCTARTPARRCRRRRCRRCHRRLQHCCCCCCCCRRRRRHAGPGRHPGRRASRRSRTAPGPSACAGTPRPAVHIIFYVRQIKSFSLASPLLRDRTPTSRP
jgi:hypothetical protein